MAAEQEEHDRLSRLMRKIKCGGAQGHEAAKAYAGIKSDEELIEWAKAALPGLRRGLLGGPKSFIQLWRYHNGSGAVSLSGAPADSPSGDRKVKSHKGRNG